MTANIVNVTSVTAASVVVSAAAHSHPTKYYTKDEVDALIAAIGGSTLDPKTFVGDDDIAFLDFSRKSVRLDSVADSVLTLPIMTEAYDGSKLKLILTGEGAGTLLCQGDDTIWNETDTQLTGTTQYSSVDLEYVWAQKMFVVRPAAGSWGSE